MTLKEHKCPNFWQALRNNVPFAMSAFVALSVFSAATNGFLVGEMSDQRVFSFLVGTHGLGLPLMAFWDVLKHRKHQ